MEAHERGLVSISRKDWSLDRRGERDAERHEQKVKEAIKGNLGDLVSDGNIITADPQTKKKIKVPLRSLELPDIRYGEEESGVGTGDGSAEPGDGVGNGSGEGEAGDQPGEEYYETEMTIDEIQGLVFEDLKLPNIQPKAKQDIESDEVVFNDVRKNRSGANMDMDRTIKENMLRNAQETGRAVLANLSPEDFRVRRWEEEPKPTNNAVVIAMADVSASMGEHEKYITRAFCWWAVSFLRTKYPSVDIVFVAHDTEAQEVTEEQFFSRGAGGGTKCSSANKMVLDMVQSRYPTQKYNVYPLHFSDGDNWGGDNEACVDLVGQLLEEDVNQYAYIQIGKTSQSGLLSDYKDKIKDDRFKGEIIAEDADVLKALKDVFSESERG